MPRRLTAARRINTEKCVYAGRIVSTFADFVPEWKGHMFAEEVLVDTRPVGDFFDRCSRGHQQLIVHLWNLPAITDRNTGCEDCRPAPGPSPLDKPLP